MSWLPSLGYETPQVCKTTEPARAQEELKTMTLSVKTYPHPRHGSTGRNCISQVRRSGPTGRDWRFTCSRAGQGEFPRVSGELQDPLHPLLEGNLIPGCVKLEQAGERPTDLSQALEPAEPSQASYTPGHGFLQPAPPPCLPGEYPIMGQAGPVSFCEGLSLPGRMLCEHPHRQMGTVPNTDRWAPRHPALADPGLNTHSLLSTDPTSGKVTNNVCASRRIFANTLTLRRGQAHQLWRENEALF